MKSKVYEGMLLVLFLLTTALAACTDDEPKDTVKEIRMTVLPETAMIRPTMSTSWNEIMSSWYLPRSLSLTALRVSWSRVCSPAWLNTTRQNFLKRSCAA